MYKLIMLLLLGFAGGRAYGVHVTTGFYKSLMDVQDKNGKEATNPLFPAIGVGTNFEMTSAFRFSPQLGYISHTVDSKDSYGKYKMSTIFLLYDVLWLPKGFTNTAFRFGLGTFRKSISGKGGAVTIPNGNSTMTAYRPGKSQTSYSGTFNLGADIQFEFLRDWFDKFGVRGEMFVFRPLSKEYRNYSFILAAVGYF